QTRGIALWEDLVIAVLPDGRVIALNRDSGEIVWDKKVAGVNEFGSKERLAAAPITAEGKVIIANGAGDAGTRGWVAALDAKTGNELWRWYAIPKPGEPGSETWKDKTNAWKTGGGGLWQTGSYDPATRLTIWGTGNPVPQYDPEARPGDNLYTDAVVAVAIKTGMLVEYDPKLDVQKYVPEARALRADASVMKRACPTWHGGVAHQPTAYNPVKHLAYGVGAEGCFTQNGSTAAFKGPEGGLDREKFSRRTYTSDLYYGSITAYDVTTGKIRAKAVTDIE